MLDNRLFEKFSAFLRVFHFKRTKNKGRKNNVKKFKKQKIKSKEDEKGHGKCRRKRNNINSTNSYNCTKR